MTRRTTLLGLLGCGVLSKGQTRFDFDTTTTGSGAVIVSKDKELLCQLDAHGNLSLREGAEPREVIKYILNLWVTTSKDSAAQYNAEIRDYQLLFELQKAEIKRLELVINRLQKEMIEYPQRNTGGIA